MSIARGFVGGEAVEMPAKRYRVADDELLSTRRKMMKRWWDQGISTKEISVLIGRSVRRVEQELKAADPNYARQSRLT